MNITANKLQHKHKIAIVKATFNSEITDLLLNNTLDTLRQNGFFDEDVTVVHVPGAVEIGFVANRLAIQKEYGAIICLVAVIKGETAHFEYVSKLCTQACHHISMTQDIPVIFGVLTVYNLQQAIDRANGKTLNMGRDAAIAAIDMLSITEQLA